MYGKKTQATEYQIATALQQQLANAILLHLNHKRYHWQTYGPLFRELHFLFDGHAREVLGTIDPLGQRLRILGASPVTTLPEMNNTATVSQSGEKRTFHHMLQEAFANHEHVIQKLRQAIKSAGYLAGNCNWPAGGACPLPGFLSHCSDTLAGCRPGPGGICRDPGGLLHRYRWGDVPSLDFSSPGERPGIRYWPAGYYDSKPALHCYNLAISISLVGQA